VIGPQAHFVGPKDLRALLAGALLDLGVALAGYTWGTACGGLEMLRTIGIQTGTSPDAGLVVDGHPEHVINRRVTLVPDGVASVNVRLRHGRSVTVPVRDNVYRHTIHGVSANLGTTWFDATGQRIDRPKHR
jgi:hypothetical protein